MRRGRIIGCLCDNATSLRAAISVDGNGTRRRLGLRSVKVDGDVCCEEIH